MDEKVFSDILNNFKGALFNDMKILTGLMDSNQLREFIDESFNKLYKSE